MRNTRKNKFRPSLLGSWCHGRWISGFCYESVLHQLAHVSPRGSLRKREFSSFCSLRGHIKSLLVLASGRWRGGMGFKKIVHLGKLPGFCGDFLLPCDLTVMGVNTPDFTPLRDLNTADVKSDERQQGVSGWTQPDCQSSQKQTHSILSFRFFLYFFNCRPETQN